MGGKGCGKGSEARERRGSDRQGKVETACGWAVVRWLVQPAEPVLAAAVQDGLMRKQPEGWKVGAKVHEGKHGEQGRKQGSSRDQAGIKQGSRRGQAGVVAGIRGSRRGRTGESRGKQGSHRGSRGRAGESRGWGKQEKAKAGASMGKH